LIFSTKIYDLRSASGQNRKDLSRLGGIQKLGRQKRVGGQSNIYAYKINDLSLLTGVRIEVIHRAFSLNSNKVPENSKWWREI